MDKYYLNGVDLMSFGIMPGEQQGSNLAISGFWDMPARTGETYRLWRTGIEPYVRADEMFFSGIDIRFTGIIEAANQRAVIADFRRFIDEINGFNDLVTFSSAFGDCEVYVQSGFTATVVTANHALLNITFRCPVVDLEGVIPPIDGEVGIDKRSFESLGMFLLEHDLQYGRPAIQSGETSVYGREANKITSPGLNGYSLPFLFNCENINQFGQRVQALRKLLSSPFKRLLNIGDGLIREVFCVAGFSVTGVYVEDHQVTANLNIPFIEADSYEEYTALNDSGIYLTDNNGLKLIFK